MGRKKINDEATNARFPEGTLKRVAAALKKGEGKADLIRAAVERELNRREQGTRPAASSIV